MIFVLCYLRRKYNVISRRFHSALAIMPYSVYDLILELGRESDESRGITANAHDKMVVLARIFAGTEKLLNVGHIALEDLSAVLKEGHK